MILPPFVKYCSDQIGDHTAELSGSEAQAIVNACEKRRNEFSTGRYLLRRLLLDFGTGYVELPKSLKGWPILPQGYCGSIAHTDRLCAAAIARVGEVVSIGIDVENIGDVGEPECRVFMPADEYDETMMLEPQVRKRVMAAAFSVREAIYKCLNPVFGRWIDFHDARVSFSDKDTSLINVDIKGYEGFSNLVCRYEIRDDTVFTSAVLQERNCP